MRFIQFAGRLLAWTACGIGLAATARGEDWPQFRGVNAAGVSTNGKPPVEFAFDQNVRWSAEEGDGVASPIVAQGRVFSTGMTGPTTFSVFGYDAATGTRHWRRDFETGKLPRITPPNSHASSTPASDGERVFVYFSTLGLIGLDAATGADLWRRPLPLPAYLMDWGAASSPIVVGDQVIFCQDDDLSPYLISLDAASGEVRWKTAREDMLAGYAVPVLCTANGRTDLVVAGSGRLIGYDPDTGAERWTCNTLLRTVMTSPVVHDGVIYIAVQSYGDESRTLKYALLEWLDTNQDGILTRSEVPSEFHARFDRSDRDKNGELSEGELDTAFQASSNLVGGGSMIQAVRGGGTGDVTQTHVKWHVNHRAPSNLSSPLVVGQRLFVVKAGGISSCFNSEDGTAHWELQRLRNFGDYYASPVAADGKIYIAGRNGFVIVLADSTELKVLAKNDMQEEIIATPALCGDSLFIRTRQKLYCVGGP